MADSISEKKYENPGLRGPAMSARSSRRCTGSSAAWLFVTTIVHCEGAAEGVTRTAAMPDRLLHGDVERDEAGDGDRLAVESAC